MLHCQPIHWLIIILVLVIFLEKKELRREGGITVPLEVTAIEGELIEGYVSIEPFGFTIYVLVSSKRDYTIKNLVLIALQHILNTSFITIELFALVVPFYFVLFIHNDDD